MENNFPLKERQLRMIARGEFSDHCHVICGDQAVVEEKDGNVFVTVPEDADVQIRHLLESAWIGNGKEISVLEHTNYKDGHGDIKLEPGKYKYVAQVEKGLLDDAVRRVVD